MHPRQRCFCTRTLQFLICLSVFLAGFKVSPAQDSEWRTQTVPEAWRSVPVGDLKPIDGYSWYRTLVRIPEDWDGQQLTLFIEALDDARSSWVGGQLVGVAGAFPPGFRSGLGERGRYVVEPSLVHGGQYLSVAIRVYQYDPRPNFSVAPPVLMNESRREALRLEGVWKYRPGDDLSWAKAGPEDFEIASTTPLTDTEAAARGVFQLIDSVDDVAKYVSRRNGDTDPLSPADAAGHFQTPQDLAVQMVLGDPEIAQPLFISWDERGRLWVMEYRQYPEPAGLTMVSRDTFLRSVYDKVPLAPPNHERGADRISIHEDTNGDGVYDSHRTFVDGLNIASSFAIGRGGVFVTNPPYLLFYPDRNQDDIPDGDPEVLLEGFGIEDSHSVINSLRFGPDGWLYGGQGSTVTGVVRRPGSNEPPVRSQGQIIWRYHPEKRIYEVFAEGGGNTFGCEIDQKGRIYSGHNGGDTRGFHYVQGGYYRKGFGKHGPLANPYAFGFFEHMKHHAVARFTHNFVIYEEQVLPGRFRGQLFGIEPLQGQVVLSHFRPFRSSFETEDIERVLKTDDPWFRPVDIKSGPNGDIYVADLYEQRIDHSSHYAGRIDRTSGRIYRLTTPDRLKNAPPQVARPFAADISDAELISKLDHPSKWHRQTAVRLMGDRKHSDLSARILSELKTSTGQGALERLWALNSVGGLTDISAISLLKHEDPFVRAWTVRLVCDPGNPSVEVAAGITDAAGSEGYIEVRKQMASSARRLTPELALPIINALLRYDEDAADIHQPLLLWWAIEAQMSRIDAATLAHQLLATPELWKRRLVVGTITERLMKRYALAGTRQDLLNAAALLNAAPDRESTELLLKGFEEAFQGRSLAGIPEELIQALGKSGGGSLALRFRQAQPDAIAEAVSILGDAKAASAQRVSLIEIAGQLHLPQLFAPLLQLAESENNSAILATTLTALQNFDNPAIAPVVLDRFSALDNEAAMAAETLIVSRVSWSNQLVQAVTDAKISRERISGPAIRRMLLHRDQKLAASIHQLWGEPAGQSPAEVQAETQRVQTALAAGTGNPKVGKQIFAQNCGRCHLLFEEGGRIGPDLTPFARDNLERMLISVINPGLEIREGFENYLVVTTDGRVLNGFLVERDSQVAILRGVDGQNVILKQDDIEEMKVVPQSVMPEGVLKTFNEQQLRDLFAYLRSTQPVNY